MLTLNADLVRPLLAQRVKLMPTELLLVEPLIEHPGFLRREAPGISVGNLRIAIETPLPRLAKDVVHVTILDLLAVKLAPSGPTSGGQLVLCTERVFLGLIHALVISRILFSVFNFLEGKCHDCLLVLGQSYQKKRGKNHKSALSPSFCGSRDTVSGFQPSSSAFSCCRTTGALIGTVMTIGAIVVIDGSK